MIAHDNLPVRSNSTSRMHGNTQLAVCTDSALMWAKARVGGTKTSDNRGRNGSGAGAESGKSIASEPRRSE